METKIRAINKKREYKFNHNGLAKSKFGTLDRIKKEIFYINTTFWITPTVEDDYKAIVKKIVNGLKQKLKMYVCSTNLFYSNFIYDFEVKSKHIKSNKDSFILIEAVLKQKQDFNVKQLYDKFIKDYDKMLSEILSSLLSQGVKLKALGKPRRQKKVNSLKTTT